MEHFDARFFIESERRKGEKADAAQHRLVKDAQHAGMKILPILSLNSLNNRPLAVALAHGLDWLSHLFVVWSCWIQSRYASVPSGVSPESQSSPCSSWFHGILLSDIPARYTQQELIEIPENMK